MAHWQKKLLLTLSALALLSGCDEGDHSATSWTDFFPQKSEPAVIMGYAPGTVDATRETQSGNYLASQFAQYRQDWTKANTYLDRLIAFDPENVQLQTRAMLLSMQGGDITRAITLARKVQANDPENMLALLFVSMDQMARQEYGNVHKTLSKMPVNGISDFIRPMLEAWAETPDGAPKDDYNLISTSSLHAYHAMLIADYTGGVKDPEKYVVNILASSGTDTHVLEMVADVLVRNGKPDMAKKMYETLLSAYTGPAALTPKAEKLKKKIENPSLMTTAKIQTPTQGAAEAFYNMSRMIYQEKSDESALIFARMAQYLDPAMDEPKLLMASIMMRTDHPDEAIEFLKSVKPGSDSYMEAQRSAAELMEENGKLDDSVAVLEKLYTDTKDVNALIQVGDAYRRAEKNQDAIKAYNRATDALGGTIGEDYWYLLYARGMSYERFGDMKKAEEDLEQALVFEPDHPYLLNYLGYSWADQGKKLDKAMELITKAANLRPDDGYIIDSLGWVYYKVGEYEKAVSELEKAVELIPYDPTINDHLGDAYWQVGRKQEARFQWKRALNHSKEDTLSNALAKKIEDGLAIKDPAVKEAKKDTTPAASVKQ